MGIDISRFLGLIRSDKQIPMPTLRPSPLPSNDMSFRRKFRKNGWGMLDTSRCTLSQPQYIEELRKLARENPYSPFLYELNLGIGETYRNTSTSTINVEGNLRKVVLEWIWVVLKQLNNVTPDERIKFHELRMGVGFAGKKSSEQPHHHDPAYITVTNNLHGLSTTVIPHKNMKGVPVEYINTKRINIYQSLKTVQSQRDVFEGQGVGNFPVGTSVVMSGSRAQERDMPSATLHESPTMPPLT